jgi:hypothetical protein
MKILIACEESQIVTSAFRKKGHQAFSCDIQECSGGHPEWHIKSDVLEIVNDGWDMIVAFPPCTDLSNANGNKMIKKIEMGKSQKALEFIIKIWDACDVVCIENPSSWYINDNWRKYDQIIEPYYFGHNYRKRTCLWLKNLPFLMSTIYNYPKYTLIGKNGYANKKNSKIRSKFHPLVADAMANQWG